MDSSRNNSQLIDNIDTRIQGQTKCEISADEWLKISKALCAERVRAQDSCGAEPQGCPMPGACMCPQVHASELGADRDTAIEAAAKSIYESKGDRLGKEYIGWDKEPDGVKGDWRTDVRATIDAYEEARHL